ncbi:MAG: glycosyltransferase family A protein, partial [bacterium]|nr:glycosyltransferase family A protein [bacterium]
MNLKFSILIPAVPSRLSQLSELLAALESQTNGRPVEVLVFLDNKQRSIGFKRDALVQLARGDYVAFVDDDDTVSPAYVDQILAAIESEPDVVTFVQRVVLNASGSFHVTFRLGPKTNPESSGQDII